jgi:hypothetical protein
MFAQTALMLLMVLSAADESAPTTRPAAADAEESAATAPATAPADAGAGAAEGGQRVTVLHVEGPAQRLVITNGREWKPVVAGEKLPESTIIRTGLRAKVVLQFEDRAEVTVNTATKMGIGEFRRSGKKAKVRLGLKYGTMRTSVNPGRGPNDFEISTPVATLSVRGSRGRYGFTGDKGLSLQTYTGHWAVKGQGAPTHNLRGREQATRRINSSKVNTTASIQQMKRQTRLGDYFGLSRQEVKSQVNNGQGRGIIGYTGGGTQARKVVGPKPKPARPKPSVIKPSSNKIVKRRPTTSSGIGNGGNGSNGNDPCEPPCMD